ncbi:MAG: type II toxin-antitoxin system HipA family toxin, partial [Bacteroidota bacterium]
FHTLSFPLGAGDTTPDRSVLLKYAEDRNIKNRRQILDDVIKAVPGWKEVFKNYDVPHSDIQKLEQGIAQRLDRLKG